MRRRGPGCGAQTTGRLSPRRRPGHTISQTRRRAAGVLVLTWSRLIASLSAVPPANIVHKVELVLLLRRSQRPQGGQSSPARGTVHKDGGRGEGGAAGPGPLPHWRVPAEVQPILAFLRPGPLQLPMPLNMMESLPCALLLQDGAESPKIPSFPCSGWCCGCGPTRG